MSGKKKYPQWFDGHKINEILFCESFRKEHPMICIKGKFFTVDGAIEDEKQLEAEIFDAIKFFVTEKVSSTVKSLMDVLKLMCTRLHFRSRRTGSMWPMAHAFWTIATPTRRNFA